ncbi:MAG TPA: hypothetical protein VM658_03865 [bacterium]|nr:hypothetical protein [bacterium]
MGASEKIPALLRFRPVYEGGPGAGPWLISSLGRPGLDQRDAAASIEFSQDPSRPSAVLEGPLAGRRVIGLAADFGADLVGPMGLSLIEQGLAFTARLVAADAADLPLRLLRPAAASAGAAEAVPAEAVAVLEARPGAMVYYGRRRDLGAGRFSTLLMKNPGAEILEGHPAQSGQAFAVPAGMPYVLGRGVMAYVAGVEASSGKAVKAGAGLITEPAPVSRVFIRGLGFLDGMNAVTWLVAAGPLAVARLDLRAEWEDEWKGGGPRPGFVLLTGLSGRALLTGAGETETIARGVTVMAAASCRCFRLNPGPEGASILKTWLSDRAAEIERPLLQRGLTRKEIEGLYGANERKRR